MTKEIKEKQTLQEWEKEFKDKFGGESWLGADRKTIIDFIRILLTRQAQEIRKDILEKIENYLTKWLQDFANRPIDKRENAFKEVVKIREEIKKIIIK